MTSDSQKHSLRLVKVVGFAVALCCALSFNAQSARAATMEELQAQAEEATNAYNEATSKLNEIKTKIEENQARVDEISEKLPTQLEKAETSIRTLYKMQQSTPGLVSLLLSADSFSDFITTYQYLNALQRDNIETLEELNELETELKTTQQELEIAEAQASTEQEEAEDKLAEAQNAIVALHEQLAAQAAAEAAAAAAAAAESGEASEEGTSSVTNEPANPSATDGSEIADDSSWMTGWASAYSLADNTGWDATASGETLTDDSMTVAVPADQSYLLGRTVEISYNGTTITARVNDTGGFAKYGRVLDLAGGCWKAFGFDSPNAWGVRKVQYRFL